MVQKRQLYEEEYDVSPKHLKLGHNCDVVSCLQFTDHPISATEDVDCPHPGRLSTSSWASSTITEDDVLSEAAPSSHAYSYLLERPPMKLVPIGSEYQAELPELREYDGDTIKFLGYSVIPMPDNESIHESCIDSHDNECLCENRGSDECIERHINESRENLKAGIGVDSFVGLGFDEMGEAVAEKCTEDDERVFREVVYSNPVSSGRNFWNRLATEFSSRNRREIVSYYFNVFMLRRRREQNRVDPVNADSDDDEPQECDIEDDCDNSQPGKSWVNCEFTFEPFDSRVWDIGLFPCAGTKTEFLPTGSMIEEVFGVESWDFETNKSLN